MGLYGLHRWAITVLLIFSAFISIGQSPYARFVVNGQLHTGGGGSYVFQTMTLKYAFKCNQKGYTLTHTDSMQIDTIVRDITGVSTGLTDLSSILKVVYPILSSTAAVQSINLLDTGNFNITWTGSMTRTTGYYQGPTSGGSGNYGDTHFPGTNLSTGQGAFILYIASKTNASAGIDIGSINGAGSVGDEIFASTAANSTGGAITDAAHAQNYSSTGSSGVFELSATSSTSMVFYQDNVSKFNYTTTRTTSHNADNFLLGDANFGGSPIGFGSNNKIGFVVISNGLSSANSTQMYNTIHHFIVMETGSGK